jgi:hypothetical protein
MPFPITGPGVYDVVTLLVKWVLNRPTRGKPRDGLTYLSRNGEEFISSLSGLEHAVDQLIEQRLCIGQSVNKEGQQDEP